jgi:type IX secretion system PorP/SprF family membrane protein
MLNLKNKTLTSTFSQAVETSPVSFHGWLSNRIVRSILFICFLSFPLFLSSLKSQQLPIYSQYMMNSYLLNPAVAGNEGYTSLNLTVREQWLGLKDAPSTYAVSAQTRLLRNSFISRSANIRKRRKVASRSGRVGMAAYVYSDLNLCLSYTHGKVSAVFWTIPDSLSVPDGRGKNETTGY